LARWILMSHDRLDGDDVPLTHEFLALMLGVRRAGVTVTLHILEGERMIKATRGHIRVIDHAKLEAAAKDSYGLPEAEYERVIGGRAQEQASPPIRIVTVRWSARLGGNGITKALFRDSF
jgi:DNA-binding transcriptional regulator YhcF (GntR family)